MCNSRSLEEEAEYIIQFEPDEMYEMYQDELESSDMIIDEDLLNLDNIRSFEYSKGLYDTSICSNCYQSKLFPVDGCFSLLQCPGCNLNLTIRFEKTIKFNSYC